MSKQRVAQMHNLNNAITKQGIQRLITMDIALWMMAMDFLSVTYILRKKI